MADQIYRNEASPSTQEVDLVEILLALWRHRKWIAFVTILVTVIGAIYGLTLSPMYRAEATLAPKQPQGIGASRLLAQFGGGGFGNTNLDQMGIILKSYGLAEKVIARNKLLPALFPDKWDSKKNGWKSENPNEVPTITLASHFLRNQLIDIKTEQGKGIIRIGAQASDPEFARDLVSHYLFELQERIRTDVMQDADLNRDYLEKQLDRTSDPALQEKIQIIIAVQIEKSMLAYSQAFEVLEEPIVPTVPSKPNRKLIVVVSFLIGLMISVGLLAARKAEEKAQKSALTGNGVGVTKRENAGVPFSEDIKALCTLFARLFRNARR